MDTAKVIIEFAKTSRKVEDYQWRNKPKTKAAKDKANAVNAKSWELYEALVASGIDERDLHDAAMSFTMYQTADKQGAVLEF